MKTFTQFFKAQAGKDPAPGDEYFKLKESIRAARIELEAMEARLRLANEYRQARRWALYAWSAKNQKATQAT